MKKSTTMAFALRFMAALCGIVGLSSLFPSKLGLFVYYTNLSNLLVVCFYLYTLQKMRKKEALDNPNFLRFKAGVTIAIVLTFLVYALLLAPKDKPENFYQISNYTKHYLVPIFTFLDWLLFDAKGAYKKSDPLIWSLFPLIYCIFSVIKGLIFRVPIAGEPHSPYPYFFLNIDRYGWTSFFIHVIVILVLYLALGYLMLWFKKEKSTKKRLATHG